MAFPTSNGSSKMREYSSWLDVKEGRMDRVIQLASGGVINTSCCISCPQICNTQDNIEFIPWSISDISGAQEFMNTGIIGTITIPPPPENYLNDYFLILGIVKGCNTTSSVATLYDASGIVPITQHDLGFYEATIPEFSEVGFIILYPSEIIVDDITEVTVTLSNSCSSVTDNAILGCFLPGTPVALVSGTKAIEDVVVGDQVIGAFGEVNTVLALHRPLLGGGKVCRINDEHTTTTHHPHISADRKFYCPNPAALNNFTYGQKHTIIKGDGSKEKRTMTGVNRERILTLAEGVVLQTITGPRAVTKMEPVAMSPFTQVYHLVVGGSHTYTADGYAVVGWAREDDFDYDTWTPK
jgi:hypothetical protein